jgi:hopene-associated glycosyltransferase HpnB
MILALYLIAGMSLVIWLYLIAGRHGFWLARQRLGRPQQDLVGAPSVLAIIPARNEAETIAQTVSSLIKQNYPGALSVLLVDDQSEDNTVAAAKAAGLFDLRVIQTTDLPPGWSGKTWALEAGWQDCLARGDAPDYIWLNDADITHGPEVLTALVTKSQARQSALTSLMVRLETDGFWGKALIPAFIYFFQLLYPFSAVNLKESRVAGAAGGCMLIERKMLENIGGFACIKDALIDDCSLARAVQDAGGRLWLGHANASMSMRSNRGLGSIWAMVKRTAYAQLGYSGLLLIGCMLGLVLTFLVPLAAWALGIVWRDWLLMGIGAAASGLLWLSYMPTLQLYKRPFWEALALPFVTALYGAMTVHSALDHVFGSGNAWKGRHYGKGHHNG